jgi:hypothetical protein
MLQASLTPSPDGRPPRIGVVLLYDDQQQEARFAGMEAISAASIANKRAYAEMHDYSLVVADGTMIDRSRPAAWSKMPVLHRFVPQFDWVLFLDMDTLVMNPDVKIENYIDERYDVIISEDWSGVNTGVFLIRNSTWTMWFLDELWKQKQLVSGNYPFEYEQRAFHYLLQTRIWRERGLSRCAAPFLSHCHVVVDACTSGERLPSISADKNACDRGDCAGMPLLQRCNATLS